MPDTLPNLPGEFKMTVEEEKTFLAGTAQSDNSLFIVAEVNGELVGLANCIGGKKQAMKHSTHLGISIRKAWQGKGIGKAMMQCIIDAAKQSGVLTRIELLVYCDNTRAIKLYETMGFMIEGRLRNSVIRNGQYIDDFHMGLIW